MKKFIKCALIRAIKTMCQTAIGILGASTLISDVDWITLLSATGMAGVLSLLTSIVGGLPEVDDDLDEEEEEDDF